MDDKDNLNLPENNEEIPVSSVRENADSAPSSKSKTMRGIKIAYVCALILALCGAFAAKIATEKAIGSLKVPIESDYVENRKHTSKDTNLLTEPTTQKPAEAANDVKNVPDTRPPVAQEEIKVTVIESKADKYAVPFESGYGLPLGTDILKDYSPDVPSYSATMGDWRTHTGVDFAGAAGSQIKSVSAGKVCSVYNDTLYGRVVEIDHGNGVKAKYCGFEPESLEVKEGTVVENGTLLGYLGTVPCERSEGSHLHFEMTCNGATQDPIAVLGRD